MSKFFTRLATLALLASLPVCASAQDYKAGMIKIERPWMRVPPPAAKVAGGFMTLTNTGTEADRLTGGSVEFAGRIEVHEMQVVDGVMKMRQLQPGLEIKPGETVALKPGSYHLMFMDLKSAPEAGKPVKGTLVFEKAGAVDIEYAVAAAGAKGAGGAGSGSGAGSGLGSGSGSAAKGGKGSGSGAGSGSGSGSGAAKNAN